MIAIHPREGSFSDRWITYCNQNQIPYKLVNALADDFLNQLENCQSFMWHFSQNHAADMKVAKSIIRVVNEMGLRTFPSYNDCWHFDDKIAQKYIFDGLKIPYAPAHIFYNKQDAVTAISKINWPIVFKLSTGAGSQHVHLIKNKSHYQKFVKQSFGKGFSRYNKWLNLFERIRKWKKGIVPISEPLKGIVRLFKSPTYATMMDREKGYFYFQEFIPNNDCDFRVIVINEKAFAIKRTVRPNDFRASGSGEILYDKTLFKDDIIKLAFDISAQLKSSCMAYDFVYDEKQNPLLIEMSYGFAINGYDPCEGYWDKNLTWNNGKFNPYSWMIEGALIK